MYSQGFQLKGLTMKIKNLLGLLLVSAMYVSPARAIDVGWYPAATSHYHVSSVWYDSRLIFWPTTGAYKSTIGLTYQETGATNYFYPYDYTSVTEVSRANAIYATLLAGMTTTTEVAVHIFTTQDNNFFDVARLGPQF